MIPNAQTSCVDKPESAVPGAHGLRLLDIDSVILRFSFLFLGTFGGGVGLVSGSNYSYDGDPDSICSCYIYSDRSRY